MKKDHKIIVTQLNHDKDTGTNYYEISDISNWDLERLWRLLESEKERAKITNTGFNGSEELLKVLRELGEKYDQ